MASNADAGSPHAGVNADEEVVQATPGGNGATIGALVAWPQSAPGFDYTSVAPDLAKVLRDNASQIRRKVAKTTADMIEIGCDLRALKSRLPHGQFQRWVESEVGIHRRMAQRFMTIADFADGKSDTVSLLPPRAASELSKKSTPPEVPGVVIERLEAGETVSDEAVDILIREAKRHRRGEQRDARAWAMARIGEPQRSTSATPDARVTREA